MTAIERLLPALARWRLLIAAAAGAVTSFAFAPYGLFPLAIAGPAILFLLWEGATPRQAARAGFLFGVALFGAGTWWIFTAVYEFGQTPLWLAIFIMVVVLAIKGSYYLLLGWLVARASRLRRALRLLVLLPGAWLVMEWVRGWMFTGFPWLQLGYAHSDNWLIGLAPVGGIHLITLLTAVLAGALVLLLLGSARERVAAVVAAVAIWGSAFAAREGNWTAPAGEAMPIALVQGAIPQDDKWLVEHRTTTLERYHALNREALGARIIVWPESAIPVLAHEAEPFLDLIRREGRAAGSDVMVGLLSFDFETSEIRNGLYSMSADGDGWYFKRRLVPFGEFFPVPAFVRKWMRLMSLPYYDMTPGADHQAPLSAGGQKLIATICYEDAYGGDQLDALATATLLVNATNNAWFGDSAAPHQQLQMARFRAREAGRWLMRSTSNGITAVIAPDGTIVARAPQFVPVVLKSTVQPRTGLTPYARVGNLPVLAAAFLMIAFSLIAIRKRGQTPF